jgi:hypothetical protein
MKIVADPRLEAWEIDGIVTQQVQEEAIIGKERRSRGFKLSDDEWLHLRECLQKYRKKEIQKKETS